MGVGQSWPSFCLPGLHTQAGVLASQELGKGLWEEEFGQFVNQRKNNPWGGYSVVVTWHGLTDFS